MFGITALERRRGDLLGAAGGQNRLTGATDLVIDR
jgi:hypothetical protein